MSEPIAGAGGTSTETAVESTQQGDFFAEDSLLDSPAPGLGEPSGGREAAPKTEASAAVPPTAEPTTPPATPAATPAPLDQDILSRLVSANLKPVAGESREQALIRIADQQAGRAIRTWNELKGIRESQKSLEQMIEPLLRAYHQERMRAETEAAAARLPDKETDPQAYQIALQEELLRRQLQREQSDAERTTQEAQATAALDIDEQAVGVLEEAVQSDPEMKAAYEFITSAALRQVAVRFPGESADKHLELVQLAQTIDMRNMVARGINPVDVVRAAYRDARESLGLGPFTAQATEQPPAEPVPTPAVVPPAAPTPTPAPGPTTSPTAARLAAAAATERARAAVSPGAGAAAPSGLDVDITGMSEDQFVDFALDNPGVVDDIVKRKYGRESRF